MNIPTFIILAVLAGSVCLVVRKMIRDKKEGKGCCGCSGCGGSCGGGCSACGSHGHGDVK